LTLHIYIDIGDTVALLALQQTCDSQVAGSSAGWAPLHSVCGQVTYTCVPSVTN